MTVQDKLELKITKFYVDDKLSSRRRWDRAEKEHSDEIFIYFCQICKIFKKLVVRRWLREEPRFLLKMSLQVRKNDLGQDLLSKQAARKVQLENQNRVNKGSFFI